MKRFDSFRWILLAVGVIAILAITAMNVYSLYALRQNTLESDRENKKLQIAEFTDQVRYRLYSSFKELSSKNISFLEKTFKKNKQFTAEVNEVLKKANKDSIYNSIYFIPSNSKHCQTKEPIYKYSATTNNVISASEYPKTVCAGMRIARTQMKNIIKNYRYSNKVVFDSHRSITIVLSIPSKNIIFGYLTIPFNQDYMRNDYLAAKLSDRFGTSQNTGMKVWLRDWTNSNIIASSSSNISYDPEKIQFKQDFKDLFDYWELEVSVSEPSVIAASNESLFKNLGVLAVAVVLLLGALISMFMSARKEKALAERQAGFLANVTHELKTPLSVMQAAGENLADGRVKEKERLKNYGEHIHSEAIRLRKMIEKLLDVAKADAGKSMIEPEAMCLADAVKTYIDEQCEHFEDKGFIIDTTIEDESAQVMIDPNNFETIISNLVENAVKYSPFSYDIYIRLYRKGSELILEVEDNGVGMAKKVSSQIFNKFYRAEDTLTAETKGHGLGLSIVKNLVAINGGTIKVESAPHEGSTFIVTFPIIQKPDQGLSKSKATAEISNASLNKESGSHA